MTYSIRNKSFLIFGTLTGILLFSFQNCSKTSFDVDPALKAQTLKNETVFNQDTDSDVVTVKDSDDSGDTHEVPVTNTLETAVIPVSYYCSTYNHTTNLRVVTAKELTLFLADKDNNLFCEQSATVKEDIINKKSIRVAPCADLIEGGMYKVIVAEKSAFQVYLAVKEKATSKSAIDSAFEKLVKSSSILSDVKVQVSTGRFTGSKPIRSSAGAVNNDSGKKSFYLTKSISKSTVNNVEADDKSSAVVMFSFNADYTPSITSGYDSTGKIDLCDLRASPLIVSLGATEAKGIALTSPLQGIKFDILGARSSPKPYTPKQISWLKAGRQDYYFIVLPKHGAVDGIDQLFGDNTLGPDRKFAANGYLALAKYDTNRDKLITESDAIFSELRLWRDDNRDGKAQPNELFSFEDMKIAKIDLKYDDHFKEVDQYGNETRMKSVVETTDGKMHLIFDLWFRPIIN